MGRVCHIHFVGIGGVGMGGIAEVLLNQGYTISGSDISENSITARLQGLGAKIYKGHHADYIADADVIVFSAAIASDNQELQAAHALRIPVIPRAEMLAELMRFQYGIAIAGTHGKTTTTSLVASLLAEGGLDPTFVVGGCVTSFGVNARLGESRYFIAEADESDASFLHLQPMLTVVTNIDEEHLVAYENSFTGLRETFLNFLHNLPFYGTAILCLDDPIIKQLLPEVSRPVITYGFDESADVRVLNYENKGLQTHCTVGRYDKHSDLDIVLNFPGKHNTLNALAAITVATECHVKGNKIMSALQKFSGVGRRFQLQGEYRLNDKQVTLIDDYGHHPREITAVIDTVREVWPERRLVAVFQPHRYSRTEALFEDFVKVLSSVDVLFLLNIYSAGETPIVGIDSRSLCRAIRQRGQVEPIFVKDSKELTVLLEKIVEPGDIMLAQGAGNIGRLVEHWVNTWQKLADTVVS